MNPVWRGACLAACLACSPLEVHAAQTAPAPSPIAEASPSGQSAPAGGAPATADEAAPIAPRVRTEARAAFEYESLSNGYGAWRSASVDVRQQTGNRSWSAGLRETTRFSLHDDTIAGGLYHPLSRRSGALFEVELSPSHHIVPRLALAGRVDAGIGRGWVLNAGLRHRRYDAAVVELTELGIERYAGAYRFVYIGYLGHLHGGGTAASQSIRVDRLYGREQSSLFGVTLSGGTELERIAASGILRTNVRTVSITGRHWVTPRWAIVYAAGVHGQGDLYARRGGTAGLISRF